MTVAPGALIKTIHTELQRPMQKALGWLTLLFVILLASVALPVGIQVEGIPNYLEWHVIMEVASIIVSAMVFAVGWRSRARPGAVDMTFLAIIFLAVGIVDLAHTLSYVGMPDYFSPNSPDKHLNFWMVARILAAIGLLVIAFQPWHHHIGIAYKRLMLGATISGTIVLQWIVINDTGQLPKWFVVGEGLTPLKIYGELLIVAMNLMAAVLLWRRMKSRQPAYLVILFTAVCIMAMSEIFFSIYTTLTGVYNVLGHIYKVIAYLLIYRAFVVEAIEYPYTELAAAERRLREDEERFRKALEAAPNAMLMINDQQTIVLSNARCDELFGYEPHELIGNPIDILVPDTLKSPHRGWVAEYIKSPVYRPLGQDRILHARRKSGELFRAELGLTPLTVQDRTFVLASIVDITARLEADARIEKLIYYDSLTDLPNRQLLKDRVDQLIASSRQNHSLFALIYIDLDRFKNINETLGHSIGDRLLTEVARRMQLTADPDATVARVVGDEFAVVMSLRHEEDAARMANQMLAQISRPYDFDELHLALTPSIGISLYPEDGQDFETLMKSADVAMQLVKLEGRNAFHFFAKEMQQRTARMLQLESALLSAIEEDQLHLVYQPQIRIADGQIIGVEALLRWNHPGLGPVSPAEFMPIAENSGQIISIGAWVLRTAVNQLKQWMGQGKPPMIMSVNLSAIQFRHPNLIGLVNTILTESELPPEYLELELTESAAMLNPDHAIKILQALHKRGVRLSIDDFGTGYSSLSYLKKFNIYKLKIDQSFVRDIATDSDDRAIVSAIIQMAESLGFHTIAEGVETKAQLDFLRERGCHEIQGYLYSKPLTADALCAWLEKAIRGRVAFRNDTPDAPHQQAPALKAPESDCLQHDAQSLT